VGVRERPRSPLDSFPPRHSAGPRQPRQERVRVLRREQSLLEVIEAPEDGRIRVYLRGELDLAGAPTVIARLRGLRERRETVLVDLDELAFIDARGLRALLSAADDAAGDGVAFTVTRGSLAVRRFLTLVGVDGQLPGMPG
jgi:anti-anti-sigma factor